MDKEKTSKIAERLRAISSRSGEVARDVLRRMVNATMAAQIAESPAVMTAAGQKIEKDGSVSFDNAEDPGVIKLRNNLPKIGTAGILGSTYGILGPRGIARYALEGIDYTSPSHWVAKGAAKLGLGASQAYDLGLVSDMVASAYPGFRKSVNGLKDMYHGIGNPDAVSEGAKEALIGLGGFGLGHLVGWGWNAAANGIRKAKNLARIDDLKTLGEYDDIVSNLRRYHSGYALDRPGVGKLDNVRVEVAPSMAGGTADADYSGWSDIIRINPDAKHLQLSKEYTNALLAHEGTHAAFNRMPLSSQVSVDGRDYFMANSANPDVAPVAHLFQMNDPKGVGAWMASPEEYVSEMGFLRQLTGQNKRFGDLSPFYKNRFNTYLSNRFDFTPKESLQVIGALGKKYPDGGKFFRTNLQNESPLMYQPILPSYPDVQTPMRYEPLPHYGLYEYPSTTGMAENYPVTLPPRVSVAVLQGVSAPEIVKAPIENLFSDEMVARRALKQRYAESAFNDKAKSKAGAQGAWQIMPITLKDYLGRGKGKAGDLNDPEYNRKVRDWVMGIIPRDLKEFWSDSDSERAKLAKLYAAYNWGAGNLRSFLRKKRDAGVDISNPDNWVDDLNPETRRYVKYLAFDEDIPDSIYTNSAFEDAARKRGYMAEGGKIHIKPENRGKFTALKKRTGKSASWFKAHGTPLQKKRATFALNARKWKHGNGGFLNNYFYDGGPYGVIPLGGDYLTYLQAMPEVSGGAIDSAVVTAALPAKFNGSQAAAARYAEGYQKGAKPVSEAMSRAGQDIFNTVDTVVGLTPTPAGAISWLGHMGADTANGEYGKVGRDLAMAAAMGLGLRAVGKGATYLKNYWDEIGNFGEDTFRAFTDRVPGRVSTNFTYDVPVSRRALEEAELAREFRMDQLGVDVPIRTDQAVGNSNSASFEPGFWSNKALGLMAKQGNAKAAAELATRPYEIENLGGGYMLKSLMRGNPLEKQISKNGTVNVNNVRTLVGKGSKVEQAVVDKVLASEEFAGKKSIDYNKFRKAVQDELITYDRTPDTRWATYGEEAIGFRAGSPTELREINDARTFNDKRQVIEVYGTYEEKLQLRDMTHLFRDGEMTEAEYDDAFDKLFSEFSYKRTGGAKSETFTFSSPRIPSGSAKHYDANTLGHSRTYTTADEPDVLHVMESQSDWGQGYKKMNLDGEYNQKRINSLERRINNLKESINSEMEGLRTEKMNDGSDMSPWFADSLRKQIEKDKQLLEELTFELDMRRNPKSATQQDYLAENFTSRQIQENLRYAAEKGQTKMRYPTKETAAKIEGYPKETNYYDADGNLITDSRKIYTIGKENEKELDLIQRELDRYYAKFNVAQLPNGDYVPAGNYSDNPYQQLIEAIPRKQAAYDGWRANHPNATSEKGQRVVDEMKQRAEEIKNFRARVKYLNQRMKELKSIKPYVDPSIKEEVKYMHEDDILRKYNEFPKQFKKLYKGADVRMVTDPKGNTWYEVDVPENYLQQEWAYEDGGSIILPKMMMDKHSPDKLRKAIASIKAKRMN